MTSWFRNRRSKVNGSGAPPADYAALRQAMVEEQLVARGISDPRVLDAMRTVPRDAFVPEEIRPLAYTDQPLPVGEGQTISQPYMVAVMTEALELTGGERVLEVGTGSGYQAAVLARLAREVFTIEQREVLARAAIERLVRLGLSNVHVRIGDGTLGWPEQAPFDAIVVTAAAPRIPPPLLEQLAEGGRLVIPVGDEHQQELWQVRKHGTQISTRVVNYCRFVPLRGQYGWPETEGQ
ncbi:MAG: protein-L-isoaspartate(D-aspartate) O-methyltransferase [Firmicutes bacterium]|nr:protein-L-isoaspartate(D-aspartate) O-methyltransferase [Bacillota bacterium]